jgi:hypothetical protein
VCEERVADSRQHIPHIPQGPDRVQAGAPSIISDKLEERRRTNSDRNFIRFLASAKIPNHKTPYLQKAKPKV